MNPNNQDSNQPDYSFITDQPGVVQSPKSNNKKVLILVGATIMLMMIFIGTMLLNVPKKSVEQTKGANNKYIEDGFLTPLKAGRYNEVATFVAIDAEGDNDNEGQTEQSLKKMFEKYDASSCAIAENDEESAVGTVVVECDGPNGGVVISFRILVGETTRSLVEVSVVPAS